MVNEMQPFLYGYSLHWHSVSGSLREVLIYKGPSQYAYMDLFYIMEQLTAIRPAVVQELLENTDNLKIKRLFLYMAQKANHERFNSIDRSKIKLGTGKQKLTENGIYIPEYKITIPKELHEYE